MSRTALPTAAAILGLLAGSALAADPGVTGSEVRIGEILPLTGPASLAGKAHFLGTKMAVAEANDTGGVNGRKVVVVTEDDGYVPARTYQSAVKLTSSDNVFAITGTSGTSHMAAITPLLIDMGVPTVVSINPNRLAYDPPQKGIFVLGTDYADAVYAQIKYAVEKLGLKGGRFAIIHQDDDYGANVLSGYGKAVKDFGLQSVAEITYKRGQKDFSAEMLRVASAKVDFLFAGGIIAENVAMFKEANKLGIKPVIGTVWTAHLPVVQQLAGGAGDGYLTADYVATLTEERASSFRDLARKYLSEGELSEINRYSMTAYAGAKMLIGAMRRCIEVTRACVIQQLESGKPIEIGPIIAAPFYTPDTRVFRAPVTVFRSDLASKSFVSVEAK